MMEVIAFQAVIIMIGSVVLAGAGFLNKAMIEKRFLKIIDRLLS